MASCLGLGSVSKPSFFFFFFFFFSFFFFDGHLLFDRLEIETHGHIFLNL